jgi:hypothetical protein
MKIYIVVYTGGDYIGYFESEVLGVFLSMQDAIACKEKGKSPNTWSGNSHCTIEESNLDVSSLFTIT